MKVAKYVLEWHDGEFTDYVIFPSGSVMWYDVEASRWRSSFHTREDLDSRGEFTSYIDAPCVEQI